MLLFNRFEHHDAVIFLPIDGPLYSEQASRLAADLARSASSLPTPSAFWQYFSGVTHDSHGSFVVVFDDAVLALDTSQQRQISDSLMTAYESTPWYENWAIANSIRDQLLVPNAVPHKWDNHYDTRQKHATMTMTVSRYVRLARAIIANTAKGQFPNSEL